MARIDTLFNESTQVRERLGRGVYLFRSTGSTVGYELDDRKSYLNVSENPGGTVETYLFEVEQGSLIVNKATDYELLRVSTDFKVFRIEKIDG
ncbi:MAG: hypothetical protein ABJO02_03345 [Reichenbachiella sp.]|uniref:hypothetical protein n=1 Tax=Reichenbachiella sp. TaxID=2184521 RepID=UPI003297CDBE